MSHIGLTQLNMVPSYYSYIITYHSRQMMHMDPPMATLTKNDGIISLMHCQEWNISISLFSIQEIRYQVIIQFL